MTPYADGPDVSHHQGTINFDLVPPWRLFITKATEGKGFKSPTFDRNWSEMRRIGFQFRGAYHWIRSDSPMVAQVDNLERALSKHGGLQTGEFVMLDWETTAGISYLSLGQVEEWLLIAQRRWPGRIAVYSSDWVPGFGLWRERHPSYPLVYANYNTSSKSTGGWAECEKYNADIWQWTSRYDGRHWCNDPTVDMNHVFDPRGWQTLRRITSTTLQEEITVKEYIAVPPAERPGKPWFLCTPGAARYATSADVGQYPTYQLNVEQYDWLYRSVMG